MIRKWMKMLLAILVGNLIYFVMIPFLPRYLKHTIYSLDPGLLFDMMLCVSAYLLIRLI